MESQKPIPLRGVQSQSQDSDQINLGDLILILQNHWILIALSCLVFATIAAGLKIAFPKYKVNARLFVNDKNSGTLQSIFADMSGFSLGGGAGGLLGKKGVSDRYIYMFTSQDFNKTLAAKIEKSRELKDSDHTHFREKYEEYLERQKKNDEPYLIYTNWLAIAIENFIEVTAPDLNIVEIKSTAPTKSMAVVFANLFVKTAMDYAQAVEEGEIKQAKSYISGKLSSSEATLRKLADEALNVKITNNYTGAQNLSGFYDPGLGELRSQMIANELRIRENTKMIRDYQNAGQAGDLSAQSVVESLNNENRVLLSRIKSITETLNLKEQEKNNLLQSVHSIEMIGRNLAIEAETIKGLYAQSVQIDLLGVSTSNRFEIQAPATYEELKPAIRGSIAVVLGLILGFGIALGGIFVWELSSPSVVSISSLKEFSVPYFSNVQNLYGLAKDGISDTKKFALPPSRLVHQGVHQFKNLRRRFEIFNSQNRKSIYPLYAITSAHSSSGKTTISANLAWSIAQSGKKVLLIDADMLKPRLSQRFGLEGQLGFLDALSEVSAESVNNYSKNIFVFDDGNSEIAGTLEIMPRGQRTGTLEQISPAAMHNLLEQLKSQYDVVIVDTPPVLETYDCTEIFKNISTLLFVTVFGSTKISEVSASFLALPPGCHEKMAFIINRSPQSLKDTSAFLSKSSYYYLGSGSSGKQPKEVA